MDLCIGKLSQFYPFHVLKDCYFKRVIDIIILKVNKFWGLIISKLLFKQKYNKQIIKLWKFSIWGDFSTLYRLNTYLAKKIMVNCEMDIYIFNNYK